MSIPGDPVLVRLRPKKGSRELDDGRMTLYSIVGNSKIADAKKSDLIPVDVPAPIRRSGWFVRSLPCNPASTHLCRHAEFEHLPFHRGGRQHSIPIISQGAPGLASETWVSSNLRNPVQKTRGRRIVMNQLCANKFPTTVHLQRYSRARSASCHRRRRERTERCPCERGVHGGCPNRPRRRPLPPSNRNQTTSSALHADQLLQPPSDRSKCETAVRVDHSKFRSGSRFPAPCSGTVAGRRSFEALRRYLPAWCSPQPESTRSRDRPEHSPLSQPPLIPRQREIRR
jgi:hypothetical protein